jgi:hypothetical protein
MSPPLSSQRHAGRLDETFYESEKVFNPMIVNVPARSQLDITPGPIPTSCLGIRIGTENRKADTFPPAFPFNKSSFSSSNFLAKATMMNENRSEATWKGKANILFIAVVAQRAWHGAEKKPNNNSRVERKKFVLL